MSIIAEECTEARNRLLEVLGSDEAAIRQYGVTSLSILAGVRPDEQADDGVVHLLVDYESGFAFTLITLVELEAHIGQRLGRRVEIITRDVLPALARRHAEVTSDRVF